MRTCAIRGCNRPHEAKGLCRRHYRRLRAHGNPTGGRRPRLGIRAHPLGEVWRTMIRRCHDPRHPKFKLYGATGIRVCPRWRRSFAALVADVGPRPSPKHTLDRHPDPYGDYEPGNVRWATPAQQNANRRDMTIARARAAA